jgi:hypothetical protein
MYETLKALFEVARFKAAGIYVHREPDTESCTRIRSIAAMVRSVKVELLHYHYCGVPQYVSILHLNDGTSSVLTYNNRVVAANPEIGAVVATLVQRELDAIALLADDKVLDSAISELMFANAITKVHLHLTEHDADEFILQSTEYPSAAEFLSASQVRP